MSVRAPYTFVCTRVFVCRRAPVWGHLHSDSTCTMCVWKEGQVSVYLLVRESL